MTDPENGAPPPPPPRSEAASPSGRKAPVRPSLVADRVAVSREHAGYALRLEPPDLANLRELPDSRGKTDEELGADFLAKHAEKLTAALDDLPAPAAVRVLVDPYSRQAFLAFEDRVRGIVSF